MDGHWLIESSDSTSMISLFCLRFSPRTDFPLGWKMFQVGCILLLLYLGVSVCHWKSVKKCEFVVYRWWLTLLFVYKSSLFCLLLHPEDGRRPKIWMFVFMIVVVVWCLICSWETVGLRKKAILSNNNNYYHYYYYYYYYYRLIVYKLHYSQFIIKS